MGFGFQSGKLVEPRKKNGLKFESNILLLFMLLLRLSAGTNKYNFFTL